jgi:hypothetical protein
MKTIRVRAVGDIRSPLHTAEGLPRPGRFAGRGLGPEFAALEDGEEVSDIAEHRHAVRVGDLELVEVRARAEHVDAPDLDPRDALAKPRKVIR